MLRINHIPALVVTACFLFFTAPNLHAQSSDNKVDTVAFQVEGVCKMCKARIEKAALIKGVKYAEWELETSMLTVVYKAGKVDETDIHLALANAGHSTSKMKATREDYEALPGCCQYEDVDKH